MAERCACQGMQSLSLVLCSIALLLTVLSVPAAFLVSSSSGPDAAGGAVGIFFLTLLRGAVMAGGMLTLAGAGRLDGMADGRERRW